MNNRDIEQIKKDWILLHGSDLLKASLVAGYSVDLRYAKERVQLDYPGFFLPTDISIAKTDSPPAYCLQACTEVADSYCSHRCYGGEEYYLTIDNYLGKHTIVKEIIVPVKIAENEFSLDFEDWHSELDNYESEKRDWIFSYGSDLLQRSYIDRYDSTQRYVEERLAVEYPGFRQVAGSDYQRADSPPEFCLNACLTEDGSYCSQKSYCSDIYYITIDNYLGKHQIVKKIDVSPKFRNGKRIQRQRSSNTLKSFAVILFSGFAAFGIYSCMLLSQPQHPDRVISAERLAIEEELIYLRAVRLGTPPLLYDRNLSTEEQRVEIEKELASLQIGRASIQQEIELNQKLLRKLKYDD
jgi:hypothetical protein